MLSHVTPNNKPTMVDVSKKSITYRKAKAVSIVVLPSCVIELFSDGDILSKKGPVFQAAIIAGTMAVKKTSELIPFCHQVPIEKCQIEIALNENKEVMIECSVGTHHKTGVEMEALVGASTAALTIYDMCKAVSQGIVIKETRLLEKTGGKSDYRFSPS